MNAKQQILESGGSSCVGMALVLMEELRLRGYPAYVVPSALPEAVRGDDPREYGHAAVIIPAKDDSFVIIDPGLNFPEPIVVAPCGKTLAKAGSSDFIFEQSPESMDTINLLRKARDDSWQDGGTFKIASFENPESAIMAGSIYLQSKVKLVSRDESGKSLGALVMDFKSEEIVYGLGAKKVRTD